MIPTRFSQRARNLEYATERAGYAPSLAFRAMSRKDMAVHTMLNVKDAVAAGALVRMKTGKVCGSESLPTNFGFGRFTQYISSTAIPSTGSTDDEMSDSSSPSSPVSPSTSKDTPGKKVLGSSSPCIVSSCLSYSATQQCPNEGGADRKRSRVEVSAAAGASSQKRSRHDDGFTTHEALMAGVAFLGAGSSSSWKSSLQLAPIAAKAAKAVEGKAPAGMKIALARNEGGGSTTSSGSNSGSTSGSSSGSTSGSGSGSGSGSAGGGGGSGSSGKRRRVVWDDGDEEEEDGDAETQPVSKKSRK